MKRRRRSAQLELPLARGWGGARDGAGRKPSAGRRNVAHRARGAHAKANPVHVTLRCAVRSLRSQFVFPTVRSVIARSNRRRGDRFRLVHFSVQANHIHLIVEADDRRALLSGVRGFAISLALAFNRLVGRRGRLFTDRWHGRALSTPRAVRHALVYVLANAVKHGECPAGTLDPLSSAPYFRGFSPLSGRTPLEHDRSRVPKALRSFPPPIAAPRTWLLQHGWPKHGPIALHEAPRGGCER